MSDSSKQKRFSSLQTAFYISLILTTISAADFFGLETASRIQSERVLQRLLQDWRYTASYGPWANHSPSEAARDVLVVEFDEEDYALVSWPIPFEVLNEVINKLSEPTQTPKAAFFDIVFATPRLEDPEKFCKFAQSLQRITNRQKVGLPWPDTVLDVINEKEKDCIRVLINERSQYTPVENRFRHAFALGTMEQARTTDENGAVGFPVLLGAPVHFLKKPPEGGNGSPQLGADGSEQPNKKELQQSPACIDGDYCNPPDVSWAQMAILDQVATLVTINTGAREGLEYYQHVSGFLPSPAYLLARFECDHADTKSKSLLNCDGPIEKLGDALEYGDDKALFDRRMYLYWGAAPAFERDGCMAPKQNFVRTIALLLFGQLYGTSLGDEVNNQPCAYHDTTNFRCLLEDAKNYPECAETKTLERVLFFGVNMEIIRDYVTAPVQGRLPAVHAHSTAFDNYLTKSSYRHNSDSLEVWLFLFQIFVIFLFTYLFLKVQSGKEEDEFFMGHICFEIKKLTHPLSDIWAARVGAVLGTWLLAIVLGLLMHILWLTGLWSWLPQDLSGVQHELEPAQLLRDLLVVISFLIVACLMFAASWNLFRASESRYALRSPRRMSVFIQVMLLIVMIMFSAWMLDSFLDPNLEPKLFFSSGAALMFLFLLAAIMSFSNAGLIYSAYKFRLEKAVKSKAKAAVESELKASSAVESSRRSNEDQEKKHDTGSGTGAIADTERFLRRIGPHIFILVVLFIIVTVLALLFSKIFSSPAPNVFATFAAVLISYWLVFKLDIEENIPEVIQRFI